MVDYEKLNAEPVAVVPDHKVVYISGPMSHCKSKPEMTEPDYNYGTFNEIDQQLTAQGFEVVNPTKTQASIDKQLKETGISASEPAGWQALLKQDLLSIIKAGVTDVVFIPPAHTINSTPEHPDLRTWKDSSGACLEALFAYKLGANFGQAIEGEDGTYKIEPISRDEIRDVLAQSKTLMDLQVDYTGPAINQGAQALEGKPKTEAAVKTAVTEVASHLIASGETHDAHFGGHTESEGVSAKA